MYTKINFKSKKALKEFIAEGKTVGVFQPNDMFGSTQAKPDYTGWANVEGPHYPRPHSWYAQVYLENGRITKVK